MDKEQRCENCRFLDEWGGEPREVATPQSLIDLFKSKGLQIAESMPNKDFMGCCRRFPPSFRSEDEEDVFVWPHTQGEEWCGEWREKP